MAGKETIFTFNSILLTQIREMKRGGWTAQLVQLHEQENSVLQLMFQVLFGGSHGF